MKNKSFFALLMALMMVSAFSCKHQPKAVESTIDYADTTYWYSYGDESHDADVFYVYPTVSTISYKDNGNSWFADITLPEVREDANDNQRFNKMLYGEYNFYAPYYHQMIFEAYQQPNHVLDSLAHIAAKDVDDAFQYYMAHYNHGRPFFLMGHSQGSQMLINLLKNGMTDEQRKQMVAAYCIGYQVTRDELIQYPNQLCPAMDSTETGKLVIFNSVTDTTAIGMVSRNDVVGVNPTTWTMATDTVPAEYQLGMAKYNDARDQILIVPCPTRTYLYKHTTVCPDLDPEMVFVPAYEQMFPKGNLHFADSWLFGGNVLENMRCRLSAFEASHQVLIMSYNVQHCAGMDKKVDYDRTAEVIRKQQPDIVTLQELDSMTARSKQHNQLSELANRTSYYPVFGSAIDFDGGKYGVGVLTRERPLSTRRIPLPGEEPRVLLVVELQNYVMACTHLDLEEEHRLASVPLIVAEAQRWQKPFILAGDWNDTLDSNLMNEMTKYFTLNSGTEATFPAYEPQDCLDYIASFKEQPGTTLEYDVMDEPLASDHRPIMVRLRLPL